MENFKVGWDVDNGDTLLLTNGCTVFRGVVSNLRKCKYSDYSYFNIGSEWEFSTKSPSLPHHIGFIYILGKLEALDDLGQLKKNNSNFSTTIFK